MARLKNTLNIHNLITTANFTLSKTTTPHFSRRNHNASQHASFPLENCTVKRQQLNCNIHKYEQTVYFSSLKAIMIKPNSTQANHLRHTRPKYCQEADDISADI